MEAGWSIKILFFSSEKRWWWLGPQGRSSEVVEVPSSGWILKLGPTGFADGTEIRYMRECGELWVKSWLEKSNWWVRLQEKKALRGRLLGTELTVNL